MIPIKLLNGQIIHVNADLVETVASAPDTIITLTSGRKIVASTSPEEILEAVVRYRRRILAPQAPDGSEMASAQRTNPPGC